MYWLLFNQHYQHRTNQKLRSWANAVFQNRGVCGQAFPSLPPPSPLIPFLFCSRPNFLDELARKRLLCRLAVACARLSDSIARTYENEQSENKTLSPVPARFSHFFLLNDFSPLSRSLEQAIIQVEVLAWCYHAWALLGYITRLAFRPVAEKKIRQLFYILSGSPR